MMRGDLAQHVVAGRVAAGVVHHLEAIEIEVAQRVRRIAGLRGVHGLLQPPLELAAIDEAGERVVARLIGHLAREAAQLAGVVQTSTKPRRILAVGLQRRDADFDRALGRRRSPAPARRAGPW